MASEVPPALLPVLQEKLRNQVSFSDPPSLDPSSYTPTPSFSSGFSCYIYI